jgi:hypothetical protein
MVKAWVLEEYVAACIQNNTPLVAFSSNFATKMIEMLEQHKCRVTKKTFRTCARISERNFPFTDDDHPHRKCVPQDVKCVRCADPASRKDLDSKRHYRCFQWDGPDMIFVDMCGDICECVISVVDKYVMIEWEHGAAVQEEESDDNETASAALAAVAILFDT